MPASEFPQIDDLRQLFLEDTPLLDVRAPVEFADGAFPTAENHPLMNDSERHRVGITYQDQGQDQAIALGRALVSGELKAQRIAAWQAYLQRHPNAVLYCFRGGMRSQISQQWLLEEAGIRCPRVAGGFKAMRRFLIDELERNSGYCRPVVIGGRTGVGKTRLLVTRSAMIDLEGLARHRGSAFGHHPQPQPAQIDFENALSIALLKQVAAGNQPVVVEDESRNIGSRHIPPSFFAAMEAAPLVLLEASDEERVDITLQEYVHDSLAAFRREFGQTEGFQRWSAYLQGSVDRIRRRLGGDRHAEASRRLHKAMVAHARHGETALHRDWIAFLLHEYYDGMYNYQLHNKAERTAFRGTRAEVEDFLNSEFGITARRQDLGPNPAR